VAVNSIYASIIPSYKYNLVLKPFSYGTQVMGHPVYQASRGIVRLYVELCRAVKAVKCQQPNVKLLNLSVSVEFEGFLLLIYQQSIKNLSLMDLHNLSFSMLQNGKNQI
jgi:hypothetical protein